MKSLGELEQMLVTELVESKDKISKISNITYYNEYLGDGSILLSSILAEHLLGGGNWAIEKWFDDSILTKMRVSENKYAIWGIMIWGRENSSQQWVDPFYFEIQLTENSSEFSEYTFLFSEEGHQEITYDEFNKNRNIFDRSFYKNKDWNPSERNWKYIIHSKNNYSVSK